MIRSIAVALLLGAVACDRGPAPPNAEVSAKLAELTQRLEAIEKRLGNLQAAQAAAPAAPVAAARAAEDFDKVHDIEVGTAPVRGPKDAPLTLVAYSDFECPFCARAEPTIEQLRKKYAGKLRVVFKHFPLSFHPAARPLALASMAAQAQNKFWEFHDVIWKHNRALDASRAGVDSYAKEAGLDLARFHKDLEAHGAEYEARIAADLKQGGEVDVRGTPTFYINGRKLDPRSRSADAMSAVFDRVLAEKG